jgi:hypothetical protein
VTAQRVNGGRRGEVRRREEEDGGFMAGREAPPARIHGGTQASPCGYRAPRGASGTRGALKATTDDGRVIIKYADRRPSSLTRGAGVSVASCRVLPVPPIGSCHAGACAGCQLFFLGSMARRLVFGGAGAALFWPPNLINAPTVFWKRVWNRRWRCYQRTSHFFLPPEDASLLPAFDMPTSSGCN